MEDKTLTAAERHKEAERIRQRIRYAKMRQTMIEAGFMRADENGNPIMGRPRTRVGPDADAARQASNRYYEKKKAKKALTAQ